jgi:hypothetical protein
LLFSCAYGERANCAPETVFGSRQTRSGRRVAIGCLVNRQWFKQRQRFGQHLRDCCHGERLSHVERSN